MGNPRQKIIKKLQDAVACNEWKEVKNALNYRTDQKNAALRDLYQQQYDNYTSSHKIGEAIDHTALGGAAWGGSTGGSTGGSPDGSIGQSPWTTDATDDMWKYHRYQTDKWTKQIMPSSPHPYGGPGGQPHHYPELPSSSELEWLREALSGKFILPNSYPQWEFESESSTWLWESVGTLFFIPIPIFEFDEDDKKYVAHSAKETVFRTFDNHIFILGNTIKDDNKLHEFVDVIHNNYSDFLITMMDLIEEDNLTPI